MVDGYTITHEELKEKEHEIRFKMRDLENVYLNSHGVEDMDLISRSSILMGLKSTKEWRVLEKQLNAIYDVLIELYGDYLENECNNCKSKKDKIIAIKEKFGCQIHNWHIAKAVNCSNAYIREFDIDRNGNVKMKPQRKKLSSITRKKIIKRDKNSCVLCGANEDLQIHHVNPVRNANLQIVNDIDNLVTLCKKCHYFSP